MAEEQRLASLHVWCVPETVRTNEAGLTGTAEWCSLPDGTRHGQFIAWHPNGVKASEGDYRGGKKNGRWLAWDDTGEMTLVEYYRDGKVASRRETAKGFAE